MKIAAVILGVITALIAAAVLFMDDPGRLESHFKSYRELEQSELIAKGWVPDFVPESAYDIHESHHVEHPYVNVRFKFVPGDVAKIKAACTVNAKTDSITSYRCKYADAFVIVNLSNDGTGEIRSE